MKEKKTDIFAINFNRLMKTPRISLSTNGLVTASVGALIGALCTWIVLTINDFLPLPWSYLCVVAIPLIAKTVVMWIGTLIIAPFVENIGTISFKDQTGITIPNHQIPPVKITGSTLTLAAAATTALTIYLSGLKPDGVTHINNNVIYYITIAAGAVAALTEYLSNPTVIKTIWYNQAEYQKSPLFQQSTDKNQIQTSKERKNPVARPKPKRKKGKNNSSRRRR